jgi:hypothetical protein
MVSNFRVQGVFITDEALKQLVAKNKEILVSKDPSNRQLSTFLFLNTESKIDLVESSD